MMCKPIKQSRRQFSIAKYTAPFREREIGGNDDTGSFTMYSSYFAIATLQNYQFDSLNMLCYYRDS